LGPGARPIDRGSYAESIPLEFISMTQALGVPKWSACMSHAQPNPSATCALGCAQPQAGSLSATCAQWYAPRPSSMAFGSSNLTTCPHQQCTPQ